MHEQHFDALTRALAIPHAPGRVAAAQRRGNWPAQPGTGGRHAHRLPLPRLAVQTSQAVLLGQMLMQGPVSMPGR